MSKPTIRLRNRRDFVKNSLKKQVSQHKERIDEIHSISQANRLQIHLDSKDDWRKIVSKTKQTVETVSEAITMLESALSKQSINADLKLLEQAMVKIDEERLDLAHIMENENLNAQKGYVLYREYREASRLRRLVKDSIFYLNTLKNSDIHTTVNRLRQMNEKLSKSEEEAKYYPRIRTDLICDEKVCPSYLERVELYGESNGT